MKIKKGVMLHAAQPQLVIGLMVADAVWWSHGQELVVTEVFALGGHSEASIHYTGFAADLRSRYFDNAEKVAADLREALGDSPDWDVVVHKSHIHIEWQPKGRT